MQTRQSARFAQYKGSERNEELVGVLMAISIVSKRLAGRISALEQRRAEEPRGGKVYDTRQGTAVRQ